MIHRTTYAALAVAAASIFTPALARADGSSPFTIGIGKFIPTSPSSSVEGFAPFPGTSINQRGNFGLELSFGRNLIPGGYQITAMVLTQKQTGFYNSISGPVPADETVTQIPLLFEGGGTQLGPVRFGGGLGYDFVSHSSFAGASSPNGLVGETFLEVAAGSGAAIDARYLFGQRAALSGIYLGVKTRL